MSDGYSYDVPDEKAFVHTLSQLFHQQKREKIAKLLDKAKCDISPTGTFSRIRWNCYATTITFYLPIGVFAQLTPELKREISSAAETIFPKDAGYDITNFEFSPTIEQPFEVGAPSSSLRRIIEERNITALDTEFQRATSSVQVDPPAAVTAACAILESLCKIYIEDESLEMPTKQTLKPLWSTVQTHLGLKPEGDLQYDLNRIFSGLTSVVDGVASFRTHSGSAHGRGSETQAIAPRHARLAIHAAHTMATFLLESWDAKKTSSYGV